MSELPAAFSHADLSSRIWCC